MKAFTDQLLAFWTELDPSRRLQLVVAVVATLAVLVGVGIWSAQPDWVTVTDIVTAAEANEAAAVLGEEGIDFKLSETDQVLVQRRDEAVARGALQSVGLLKKMGDIDQLPMGTSPQAMRWALLREREGNLAYAISRIVGVRDAQVNIVEKNDDAIVAAEVEPARASVVVRMMPGRRLSDDKVRGITNTVAAAVDGLTTDRVMVVDDHGTLLTREFGAGSDSASAMLRELVEYQDRQERRIVQKVQSALSPMFGYDGGFSVTALVELDLTTSEVVSSKIDGRGQVPVSEQISETNRVTEESGGIPGVDANLPERPADDAGSTEENTSDTTTNFTYPTVEEVMRRPAGGVERVSVAVQVDRQRIEQAAEAAGITPQELMTNVEETVQAAAGLKDGRDDKISVAFVPFQPVDFVEAESSFLPPAVAVQLTLGALPYLVAGIAAFLAFTYVVRPLMARITETPPQKTLEEQIAELEAKGGPDNEHITIRLRRLIDNFRPIDSAELSGLVAQHPSAAAKVLKQWKRFG